MSFGKTLSLNTSATIPQIGLGTWLSKPKEVENAVEIAVRHGYRHLDLARVYENQDEVGAALKKVIPSVVKREDLFITSKLWNSGHQPQNVEKELDETLAQIGTDYLDLYLIHWPVAFQPGNGLFPPDPKDPKNYVALDLETSLVDTWKALIALPKSKVRAIGVSNFTIEQIEGIIKATGVVPAALQIEAHPLLPQDDLVAYAKEKGIHITAYSPLGNNLIGKPKLTDYPVVQDIAKKLGATPAQVLVAWGVHRGYSVIPKSVQAERIHSNFKQVELSEEDYQAITKVGENNHTRFNIPYRYEPHWDINIFGEPEEAPATHKVKIA
ncbi:NADP-dependent oxidoreductase domain-containing protein [Schizophyllum commune]|uniref:NADP-dependent oxidoreductase domain-containing protein n=1 Tax=Schizophyllum commune (strain H4-8 / FGSC 9210) TaxID=578458 RepID=D8QAG1_SCHCM|nr:Aldo/keto reductase [Schizophyllum commune H4-8]KAI4524590.1 Aldo/keto reductase [Schizophyllum commune Loenen D]KAI5890012.1 Aldo/keto reductase [Schizophyllum commune H4-8]